MITEEPKWNSACVFSLLIFLIKSWEHWEHLLPREKKRGSRRQTNRGKCLISGVYNKSRVDANFPSLNTFHNPFIFVLIKSKIIINNGKLSSKSSFMFFASWLLKMVTRWWIACSAWEIGVFVRLVFLPSSIVHLGKISCTFPLLIHVWWGCILKIIFTFLFYTFVYNTFYVLFARIK